MIPLKLQPSIVSNLVSGPSAVTSARSPEQLEGVERALIEARRRILGALDCELDAVRALRARRMNGAGASPEVFQESPFPPNVLSIQREIFAPSEDAPPEAALDPALERATIEELNAALAAAFSQVSAH